MSFIKLENNVLCRVSTTDELQWAASIELGAINSKLSVDKIEQYVYLTTYGNPINVILLDTTSGVVTQSQTL